MSEGETYIPDFERANFYDQGFDEGETYYSWTDGDYQISTVLSDDIPRADLQHAPGTWEVRYTRDQERGDSVSIGVESSWEDAVETARWHAKNEAKADDTKKWEDYTLDGGENYRELLLTLPEKPLPRLPRSETPNEIGRRLFGDDVSLYNRPVEQQNAIGEEYGRAVARHAQAHTHKPLYKQPLEREKRPGPRAGGRPQDDRRRKSFVRGRAAKRLAPGGPKTRLRRLQDQSRRGRQAESIREGASGSHRRAFRAG